MISSNLFWKKKPSRPVEETKQVIEEQKKTSAATLDFVKKVLDDKDRLLAEALNQTGDGLRRRQVAPRTKARW